MKLIVEGLRKNIRLILMKNFIGPMIVYNTNQLLDRL